MPRKSGKVRHTQERVALMKGAQIMTEQDNRNETTTTVITDLEAPNAEDIKGGPRLVINKPQGFNDEEGTDD
jgi:hypothetical protein